MAAILPNTPVGAIPPETLRVFRLLKQLPETFVVWQRLAAGDAGGPDFLVRANDGRAALLMVVTSTRAAVRAALQGSLFAEVAVPGAAEQERMRGFIAPLGLPEGALPGLLLFPLVPQAELAAALPPPQAGIGWGAKEELTPDRFAAWLDGQLGPRLTTEQLDGLRRAFTPEVLIPARLTVRTPRDRGTEAGLSDYLLSYNQEWVLKHDLDLSDEAEAVHDDLRLKLVNGVAGSGKSLLLLYRARLLRQFFPKKRLLALTHNKALIRDLERRYLELTEGDRGVEWRTFHGWCQKYWPDTPRPALVRTRERRDIIARVWQRHLADTTLSPEVLQDEIDWVKDRLITTRAGYLTADRAGRGFGLSEALRERVYAAMLDYQAALRERNLLDYGDVPRQIWRALVEQAAPFPRYDIVLIDEAQFFAPIWFEIVKRVLASPHGQLFMVADPTQGFLKRRQSWLASGLEVRGRTHRLEKCYRTTREILAFASRFYQLRLPDDDEAIVAAAVQPTPGGAPPEVVTLTSEQDELTRVVGEVRALVAAGVPLEHILVLHADWQGAARALERLRSEFGAARVIHPREQVAERQIRVCALDAATGLESPIVFLMGAHRLCEAEGSVRLGEEERAACVRDTTRRLYMAMTRAGQRLVLTYVGEPPAALRQAAAAAMQPLDKRPT